MDSVLARLFVPVLAVVLTTGSVGPQGPPAAGDPLVPPQAPRGEDGEQTSDAVLDGAREQPERGERRTDLRTRVLTGPVGPPLEVPHTSAALAVPRWHATLRDCPPPTPCPTADRWTRSGPVTERPPPTVR